MPRTRGTIALATLGLIGIGVVLVGLENARAKRAVRAYKERLISQGEKLGIEELTPAFSAAARNAGNDLVQSAWQLRSGTMIPANMPATMRITSPGKAGIAWAQSELREPGRTTNTWETLATDVQRNADALSSIRALLKNPAFDAGLNYKQGFNLTVAHLAKLKSIAQWLSAATICELHAGNLDEALADLNALTAFSNAFRDEHLLISQLVRIAEAAIALAPTWEALQAKGWTEAQLVELQNGWESLEFMRSMARALEMERAMGLEAFDRLRKSSVERKQMFGGVPLPGASGPSGLAPPNSASEIPEFASQLGESTLSAVEQFGAEQSWRWLWSYRDELKYLEVTQLMLQVARESTGGRSYIGVYASNAARLEQVWKANAQSPAYLLSRSLAPSLEKASAKAARMEAQRALVIAAIALKRYEIGHGSLAPNLAALVPEYLAKTPVDFMDGKEMRYRLNSNGTFLLYSIGEDGKDDGGDPRPQNEKSTSRFFWTGRDLVWPMPATAEEVAAAEAAQARKK